MAHASADPQLFIYYYESEQAVCFEQKLHPPGTAVYGPAASGYNSSMRATGFLLILFLASAPLFGGEAPSADPAWETYIQAQKEIQVAFHHLVRLHLHDLRKIIEESRDLELAKADQKSERFYYLMHNAPGRIVRDQGFEPFVNFSWTDEDEEALRRSSKSFRKREKDMLELRKRLEGRPEFQEILQKLSELRNSPDYVRIQARFRFIPRDVAQLLQGGTSSGGASEGL